MFEAFMELPQPSTGVNQVSIVVRFRFSALGHPNRQVRVEVRSGRLRPLIN